uniref:Aminotransferase class V domain-containing protein n=1 Tax=Globisporangium ultimum (strain ATCC 200006 / CBS 805.95 / DAOM BR144) TaxID=431595 RepID=K3WWR9_GLOUD
MSALWPGCRNYLRSIVLGSECRGLFNLEPNAIFLNHNAYGTAAKLVLQAQAHFVNQMEMNPDRFVRREAPRLLRQAAEKLAEFLHAEPEDVVFVTNATTGMNAVLQSLDLQEGDEVLCLNLTYPAVLNTLRHLCYCTQEFVELKVVDIVLPLESYEALVEHVAAAITPNTRLAVLDHIASTTGFVLPLEKLIPLFHARGIPVLVDGASAPGQLKLNLKELGADFYVGTAYKWLFGSKSCSFLHVAKAYQGTVRPVVTSLGYGQSFVEEFSIQGTRDESNFLTIVTALDFYESVGFERVYAHNKALMDWASNFLATLWRTNVLLPPWQRAPFVSNVRIPVKWPVSADGSPYSNEDAIPLCDAIMDFLADQFGVVVRVVPFQNDFYVRISAQIYNERRDYEQLGAAILELTKTPSLVDYLASLSL